MVPLRRIVGCSRPERQYLCNVCRLDGSDGENALEELRGFVSDRRSPGIPCAMSDCVLCCFREYLALQGRLGALVEVHFGPPCNVNLARVAVAASDRLLQPSGVTVSLVCVDSMVLA